MDRHLTQSLVAAATLMPWVVEMLLQVRLLARYLQALPPKSRAALPPHPRRPWLGFLGGTRFHLAVWRSFRRDRPDDPAPVAALKARMRASLRRELVWAVSGVSTVSVLLAKGWRPF